MTAVKFHDISEWSPCIASVAQQCLVFLVE